VNGERHQRFVSPIGPGHRSSLFDVHRTAAAGSRTL